MPTAAAPPPLPRIFVFGSNLDGNHAGGAARFAHEVCGAEMGVGEGLTGSAYALPTVGHDFAPLHIEDVATFATHFLEFADAHPELEFKVTRIGCGIAGFHDDDIAPIFASAPANCLFDNKWAAYLPDDARLWGTI